ncbi:MAG: DUF106 domain-containing protein [Candidatus Altiarchaeales archaeon]|nr:DUF106 domain-containing protein [Candidatus Altiarchaeales archaeon]
MSFSITPEGQVIAVISAGLALMSLAVRKKVLDQNKVKQQREEMQELQKKIKEAQKAKDNKTVGDLYSRLMELNSDVMKQSFKPMIFTLIPFLLIFGWMRGAYEPTATEVVLVNPMPEGIRLVDLNVSDGGFYNESSGLMLWRVGVVEAGNWSIVSSEFSPGGGGIDLSKPAVMYLKSASGGALEPLNSNASNGMVFQKSVESSGGRIKITLFYNNTKSNIVASLGGFELGWFGWYFLSSMVASMVFNKIFNVM